VIASLYQALPNRPRSEIKVYEGINKYYLTSRKQRRVYPPTQAIHLEADLPLTGIKNNQARV
jgi:hypothetical protein